MPLSTLFLSCVMTYFPPGRQFTHLISIALDLAYQLLQSKGLLPQQ
jgi:hypothetical protein